MTQRTLQFDPPAPAVKVKPKNWCAICKATHPPGEARGGYDPLTGSDVPKHWYPHK